MNLHTKILHSKITLPLASATSLVAGFLCGVKFEHENQFAEYEPNDEQDPSVGFSTFLNVSKIEFNSPMNSQIVTDEDDTTIDANLNNSKPVIENFSDVSQLNFKDQNLVLAKQTINNDLSLNNQSEILKATVSGGDSFIAIAKKNNVTTTDITNLLFRSGISQKRFVLHKGTILGFEFQRGLLKSITIDSGLSSYYKFSKKSNGKFKFNEIDFPLITEYKSTSFTVSNNLSVDGKNSGLTPSEIEQIRTSLRHKIDFNMLPKGTEVSVVSQKDIVNNKIVGSLVTAIRVKMNGSEYFAYYFKGKDGAGYYDKDGISLTPSFLRHPINNPLITSKFNLKRKHPILDVVRPHWGTDYGHIKGTPIMAISDAKVKFAGNRGDFGQAVILTHPNGIETLSAHMSRFGKGIKNGVNVKKGQVIGYVGKTGLSTGYHLHFELKKDGKRVNSLTVDLPTTDKVKDKVEFEKLIKKLSSYF